MDQQNQSAKKPQKNNQPPSNLPGVNDSVNIPEQFSGQQPAQKQSENVPERVVDRSSFPEKSTQKISSETKLNRFGEPSDVIPKNMLSTESSGKKPIDLKNKMGNKKENEGQMSNVSPDKVDPSDKDSYEGPSIQDLERRSLIKKVVVFVIIGIAVIIAVIFAYNKWFNKPVVEDTKTEIEEDDNEDTNIVGPEGDLDDDGMPDEWEDKYGLNPKNSMDAAQDPDFDKLTNVKEYEYNTDPTNPDTDKDGYKDGDEVQGGFNPNGSGKLRTDNTNSDNVDSYSKLKGNWNGTISGLNYKSEEFDITLQSNGNLSGKILSEILTLEEGDMESELSGTFNYKSETNIFESKILGNASYKKGNKILTRGEFTLNLNGTAKNDSEISGTWTLIPESELFWLKQDRGNFLLKKYSEF